MMKTLNLPWLQHAVKDLFNPGVGNIPGLDVLRTLAILMVFSDHAFGAFSEATGTKLGIGSIPLIHFGWTGVDLFFVLSGFLIGKVLWREAAVGRIHLGRFLFRRGLRIWPYYFSFLIGVMFWKRNYAELVPDALFLSNVIPGRISGGWSLSTEEQFYLSLPLLLIAACKFVSPRYLWTIPVCLLTLLPVSRWFIMHSHPELTHADTSALFYIYYTPIYAHSDGLFAGSLLAWIGVMKPGWMSPVSFWKNAALCAAIAVIGVSLRRFNSDVFAFTGLAMVYASAVLFVLRDRSIFTDISKWRVFHVGSRLSFAIYLNHFTLLWLMSVGVTPTLFGFASHYILILLLSAVIAAMTFLTIESPFLQWRDRWLTRKT